MLFYARKKITQKLSIASFLLAVPFALLLTPAQASDWLGTAGDYNLFVAEDFSALSSDIEGAFAAGGDVYLDNYSIADKLTALPEDTVMVVGGNLEFPSGRIYHGSAVVGGSIDRVGNPVTAGMTPGASIRGNSDIPVDFAAAFEELKNISLLLSEIEATGTHTFQWGGLYLEGDCSSSTQIFHLDGALVESAHTFSVQCIPEGATVIFNISGPHPGMTGMSLDDLAPFADRVLYNFYQAEDVKFESIGIEGSVLAPYADVVTPYGVVRGTFIANSWQGPMQLNHVPFNGDLSVIANNPPLITSEPVNPAIENAQYLYDVEAQDEDYNEVLIYSLDAAPGGMEIDSQSGLINWFPAQQYVQSVDAFNSQCYVVPAGAAKIFEEGDETELLNYIAPLFQQVKSAIETGGEYTARESVAWNDQNQCLGCHIQTQSLLGLQTSMGKAAINEEAVAYLLDEILAGQQGSGAIYKSHSQWAKAQTALALWALSHVPDNQIVFDARVRALNYFWGVQSSEDGDVHWTTDYSAGWLNSAAATTAIVAQAYARLEEEAQALSLTANQQQVLENYRGITGQLTAHFLSRAYNDEVDSLYSVFRMVGLSELRPFIQDEQLVAEVDVAIAHLEQLFRARQLTDGGWNRYSSGSSSDPLTSAWVGLALNYTKPSLNDAAVAKNIEFLLSVQNGDGTWTTNSGLFSTRLATTSLVMAYLPVALEHLGNPDLRTGDITLIEGEETSRVIANVVNRGLTDIRSPVTVEFFAEHETGPVLIETRQLNTLASGQKRQISIEIPNAQLGNDISVNIPSPDEIDECLINNNYSRSAFVTTRVTDRRELSDTQSYLLNVHNANEAPQITSEPIVTLQAAQSFSYRVETQDSDVGDAHTFSLVEAPSGIYLDPRTGRFSSNPAILEPGTYEITVLVTDLGGKASEQTFTLTVEENGAPAFVSTSLLHVDEDAGYLYPAKAQDPNPGDELSYVLDAGPAGMAMEPSHGVVTWEYDQAFVQPAVGDNGLCQIPQTAGSTASGVADVVVAIDESGSMGGEQAWISQAVGSLQAGLLSRNIGITEENNYGLVGFTNAGSSRVLRNAGNNWTSGEDFPLLASQLSTSRPGTEDGWRGVTMALNEYEFRENSARNIILVTDEDRDNTSSSITFDSVLEDLETNNALLNVVVDARFYCEDGTRALGVDSNNRGYVADGQGGVETCINATATSGFGATVNHYVDLAMLNGGAAWDLNFLRSGGHYAESFTKAFVDIKVREIVEQLPPLDMPDLVVHSLGYDAVGQSINAVVKNRGLLDVADGFSVKLIHNHFWNGDQQVAEVPVPGLAAGASVPISVSVNDAEMTGSIRAELVVDGIAECATDNNVTQTAIVELKVFDKGGLSDTQKYAAYIVNTNDAPTLVSDSTSTLTIGQPYEFRLEAADTDKGDSLRYSLPDAPQWVSVEPISGEVFVDTSALIPGVYTFNTQVVDAAGESDLIPHVLTVSPADNNPPVFISIPVLQINAGDLFEYTVQATDPDGDQVAYLLSKSADGMFIDGAGGHIQWPSDLDDIGTHAIKVRAIDTQGASAEQLFVLEVLDPSVVNQPPMISSQPEGSVFAGKLFEYQVEAQDPDNDALTYRLENVAAGMDIDADGRFTWLPSEVQVGQAFVVDVVVEDTHGGIARQTLTLPVNESANHPPSIDSLPSTSAVTGELYQYQVIASDEDGDALSYALLEAPNGMAINGNLIQWTPAAVQAGRVHSVKIQVVDARGAYVTQSLGIAVNDPATAGAQNQPPEIISQPTSPAQVGVEYRYAVVANDRDGDPLSYGLLAGPAGMTLEGSLLSWTAVSSQVGVHSIILQVSDGVAFATQSFNLVATAVSINNTAPEITSEPGTSIEASYSYEYPVAATDTDGDALTFALLQAPSDMTISDSGLVRWSPSIADVGEHPVTVDVTDGYARASQTFAVTVVEPTVANELPSITSQPASEAIKDVQYGYQVTAIDPDGDVLTYALTSAPEGMSIDQNGLISWVPSADQVGRKEVQVTASDGKGWAMQSYSIQVFSAPQPLSAVLYLSEQYLSEGDALTITLATSGGTGAIDVELTVDGVPLAIDAMGTGELVASGPGSHQVSATIADDLDTIVLEDVFTVKVAGDNQAPLVDIISPLDGEEQLAPAEIVATVEDDNLLDYKLYLSPAGAEAWQLLAEGSSNVAEQSVATFDTTALLNGQYTLVLQATDFNGLTSSDSVNLLVDGDLKVGNFSFTVEDMSIPMAGVPIRVTRTYDSRRRFESLDFGYGWSIGYQDVKVEESRTPGKFWTLNEYRRGPWGLLVDYCVEPLGAPTVTITLPDGSVEKFEAKAYPHCNTYAPFRQVDLQFEAVGDTQSELEALNDTQGYLIGNNLVETGYFSQPVDPQRYKLTTRAGYQYYLDQDFGIEMLVDPNGHKLTYTDDGIFHSSGKSIRFVRNSAGRIIEIIDPNGNRILYNYSRKSDLDSVEDAVGAVTSYTYNQSHGLMDIVDPLGRGVVKNIYDDSGKLIAQEDAQGNRKAFDHDLAGRESVVTDRNGNTTFYYYDERGNITSEVDALGGITSYTYDEQGNQLSKTDALGNSTSATYNERNDQLTATDALGNATAFTYNDRGQELTIVDAKGNHFENTYDPVGNLLTVKDPLENLIGNHIDINGNVSKTVDALGNSTEFTYDDDGNKLTETDAHGNVTSYTYDENGNELTSTITRTLADGSEVSEATVYVYDAKNRVIETQYADGTVVKTEYDLAGNEKATVDAAGNRTEYEYDTYNRLVKTTYTDSTFESRSYGAEGNLTAETDRLGRTTIYEYDALNRQVKVIAPDGSFTETEYDATGRVVTTIDALGNRTEYEYDLVGRRILTRNALGEELRFEYDATGNQVRMIDALGHVTEHLYNALDQKVATVFHDGSVVQNSLDAVGQTTSHTDPLGIATSYEYDKVGRLVKVIDALGGETSYEYDEAGNKTAQIDAKGRITSWQYDSQGRVTKRTLPMGQEESFIYDENGNEVGHTDFNGQLTTRSYDADNRLAAVNYADGSSEAYSYNASGLEAAVTQMDSLSNGRTTSYEYDLLDRLVKETKPDGSTLEYQYDAAGNKTRMVANQVLDGGMESYATDYSYDALNRLQSVTDHNGETTSYRYDAVGNRASITYPNGLVTSYSYDSLNRLTDITTKSADGAVVSSYSYELYVTGHRSKITEESGRVTAYQYDDLYRLKQEAITDPVNGDYLAEFFYDDVGNRRYQIVNGLQTNYSYDDNDRLLQAGSTVYSYDANGSTLSEGDGVELKTYRYNARNQLVEADIGGASTSFAYDHKGIRSQRVAGSDITNFLVDHNQPYAQVIVEAEGSAGIDKVYSFGEDLISQASANDSHYFHYDGLGSTRELSDGLGIVTDAYDYQAFGELLNRDGDSDSDYLYTGEQYDHFISQYYLRARYYIPESGRFSQVDPFSGLVGNPKTLHKYYYAGNDPVLMVDPGGKLFAMAFPGGISFQLNTASISVGASALASVSVGLLSAGILSSNNDSIASILMSSIAAQKMLDLERGKLEARVQEASRARGDLVYHYTDRVSARAIFAMQCAFGSKGFRHPDGVYRPEGVYATRVYPWISGWVQSDLRSVLYARPSHQDVSSFVAMESTGFVHIGVESYKPGPRGSCIPVTAVYTGANLMLPK